MTSVSKSIRLLHLEIRSEHDIVLCRRRAHQLGTLLGFETQGLTRITTSTSEVARNAFQYAGGGKVEFNIETTGSAVSFVIVISDKGPGIENIAAALGGRSTNSQGLGLGLAGARRLMDEATIDTSPAGTTVTLKKLLPLGAKPPTPQQIQSIVEKLTQGQPASALEEVQSQNQELLQLMEALEARQKELDQANSELAETNAGVMALYDELDTLHRVGLFLATKMDLPSLLQALIDATTDVTTAEWGGFFLRDPRDSSWSLHATSGPSRDSLRGLPSPQPSEFMTGLGQYGILKISASDKEPAAGSELPFVKELQEKTQFKSCLAVPVLDGNSAILGAVVLGNLGASIFSERSERIVSSIALQAAVAIEKAQMFESVKAASEAKDRFLAMVSHELRTPLNPVLAIVSSLHDDPSVSESMREDLSVVLRNVLLETRIIDDLLDFHRLNKGKIDLVREPVDVHTMIYNVLHICQGDLHHKKHRVQTVMNAKRFIVNGEGARIQQVLWNLLKNSIKFTPAQGILTVRTEVVGDSLAVSIIDNGRGISPESLPHIFTPFEQGDAGTSSEFGGLGLGLAIAKAYVEKHDGTLVASSDGMDRGTTITVTLPLLPVDEVPAFSELQLPKATSQAGRPPVVPMRILLVDDHVDTVASLSRLMARVGHQIVTAGTCEEAFAKFNESEFDIIISDLGLPDRSGLELIAAIRQTSDVPAIALSGYGMASDIAKSKEAGFNEHVTKPVSMVALQNLIAKFGGSKKA